MFNVYILLFFNEIPTYPVEQQRSKRQLLDWDEVLKEWD